MEEGIEVREVKWGSEEYEALFAFRRRLLRLPLGLDFAPEEREAEKDDIHIAAFLGPRIIGSLLLSAEEENAMKMRQVAVEEGLRGQSMGTQMVRFAEEAARRRGFREITLHARETAVPFYLNLGYETEGPTFEEVTLPHRVMSRLLP